MKENTQRFNEWGFFTYHELNIEDKTIHRN